MAPGRKGWKEENLVNGRKGDPFKVRLARELRAKTTMTMTMTAAWMARRLHMGTRGHVTHLLHWEGRKKGKAAGT